MKFLSKAKFRENSHGIFHIVEPNVMRNGNQNSFEDVRTMNVSFGSTKQVFLIYFTRYLDRRNMRSQRRFVFGLVKAKEI